ncbi:hypothetical protein AOZ07_01355 [Glutamicibacter halophytocola]|uniref:hypothetical protein n=1 Tax=Glutamicibacter halophytocola TaxID=1933880 RepID=UPI0006D49D44|nr:hypothetical protein [Glutamicibacter halophytocola]ALG27775.1 hypothetical protein AOZ07_01355 [Glutamicibacter halophytocola]
MNFTTSLNGAFGTNERSTASWLHLRSEGYTLFLPRKNQQWYPDLLDTVSRGFNLRFKALSRFSKGSCLLCLAFFAALVISAFLVLISREGARPEVRSAWLGTAWLTGLVFIV